MFARPMLSWIWLTTKFKCNELGWLPSSSALDLACSSDSHYFIHLDVPREDDRYLRLDWLTSSSALGLACSLDLHYLISLDVLREYDHSLDVLKGGWLLSWGFDWLQSPSTLSQACSPNPHYLIEVCLFFKKIILINLSWFDVFW